MMFQAWYKKEETVKSPPDHTGTTDVPAFSPVKQEKRTPISSRTRGSMTIPGHFPKKAEHAEKALRFKGRNGEFSPPSCASGPAVRSLSLQGRQAFRNMKRKIPALLLPEDRPPVRAEAPPPADAGHKKKAPAAKAGAEILVPEERLELSRCFHRRILSPLRLPIPPFRHRSIYIDFTAQGQPHAPVRRARRGKKKSPLSGVSCLFGLNKLT